MEIIKEDIQLTEWETSLDELISSLPETKYPYIDDIYVKFTKDLSLFSAIKLIDAYNEIITTAKYCLSNGCQFNHLAYQEGERDGTRIYDKQAQYVMNLHELKSAIVWYNSAMDYLLQVIYFGFGFHGNIRSNERYQKEQKKVRWNDKNVFYITFENFAATNTYAKDVFDRYNYTFKNKHLKTIRKLANHMKHHGGFDLKEYPKDYRDDMDICLSNYLQSFSEITKRDTISYKEIVCSLIGAHTAIIGLGDYIIEQLGLTTEIFDMSNPQRLQKFIYKNKA